MIINKLFLCLALGSLSDSSFQMNRDSLKTACAFSEQVITLAKNANLSPFLLTSMIWAESRWQKTAVSHKGACGLTQVLPKYSEYTCKQLKHPETSLLAGVENLSFWMKKKNNIFKALECYNSGYACNSPTYAKSIINKTKILKERYISFYQSYGEKK